MFGPTWVWALPLAGLIPLAVVFRFRALPTLVIGSVLVVGPVMGFRLPWRQVFAKETRGIRIRVLTCNVDSQNLDAAALARLLDESRPDIVALQEWSPEHAQPVFGQQGWHVRAGKGTCLASRFPIKHVEALTDQEGWRDFISRYDLDSPAGEVHFFNVHLATPRPGLEAVLAHRWRGIPDLKVNIALRQRESEQASQWVGRCAGPVLIAGDFNIPSESNIYRDWWDHYADAFAEVGLGLGYSKFTRWYGIRIDHILADPGWHCRHCWVGLDVKSDHRPVIADLERIGH
jgi:endonuclease/exonuclease/phosphatase (EEP) superfamily protein YafD